MTSTENTPAPVVSKFTPLKKVAIVAAAVAGLIIAGTVAFAVASNNEDNNETAE